MKRIVTILIVFCLYNINAFGQKKYEMVVEKTDGTETAFNVEDVKRTYFRERNDGGGGGNTEPSSSISNEQLIGKWINSKRLWYDSREPQPEEYIYSGNSRYIQLNGDGTGIVKPYNLFEAEIDGPTVRWELSGSVLTIIESDGDIEKFTVTGVTSDSLEITWYDNFEGISIREVSFFTRASSSTDTSNSYIYCPDGNHPHYIDLGLPSGTKWACCNVGASNPEQYGSYLTFDEAQGYNPPSLDQIKELVNNTSYQWTTQNGVNGGKFTGPNGGSVFLPAAGYFDGSSVGYAGSLGNYWSSAPYYEYGGYALRFLSGYAYWNSNDYREYGLSVRPVR